MSQAGLRSWGGYPRHPQSPHGAAWRDELPALFDRLAADHGTTLAYGNGRSYGDCCLAASDHVLHTQALDRVIEADWVSGTIRVEAGTTLQAILSVAIPNGWFLPVTPGTCFVTVGGAIANDVHGKNHHVRGTFGRHVTRLSLVRSDRDAMLCSPEKNSEWFAATIGGLGLTGIIEWAELRLLPIRSSRMVVATVRFDSLAEFFALSTKFDASHEYTVAWIDCAARAGAAGRGVFMAANHALSGPLETGRRRKLRVPITPPISLINPLTLRAFNGLYYHVHPKRLTYSSGDYEPFFYPLDRILHWNRIYGRNGFQQYQCVLPDRDGEAAIQQMLSVIAQAGGGSFLAVLKRCGDISSPGLLSFPMPGVSLALDFPQHDPQTSQLFDRLDAIVRQAGGRLYAAKDAHMTGADFRAAYPAWQALEARRDPALSSRFWQRVTES